MSGKIHNYKAWEERTISEVKVKYYLTSPGDSLLVAEGNEISKGCMLYVVAKEYFKDFGSNATINEYTQWTKRGDVVNWVKSLLRNDDSPPSKLGNGSSIDEEKKVVRHAKFEKKNFFITAPGCVVLALPAPSQAHLYERRTRRSHKGKYLDLVPKHQGDGSSIEPTGIQALEPKPHLSALFQVGGNIEILSQDSGMRGCWFVCKILKVSRNKFKVQYNDMDNVEGPGKLEEWVSASRLANPDKLSLRHLGRPMIRPCPPEEPSRQYFEVGAAVEAWWNNCWWESFVLTGVSLSSNNNTYRVFLPGECRFENLHCKDLRVAKDWIDNTWVAVKPQPDILSVVRSCLEQREK